MGFQPVRSKWKEEHTQALASFKQSGLSASEIAKRMNLTRGQVLGRIYRMEHPYVPKVRATAWTHQQMEIVRRGALYGTCIDEICELLARAGREMKPKAIQDSRHYRLGLEQAKAVEKRMSHSMLDRARFAQAMAGQPEQKVAQRPGTYRCPHHPNDRINLAVVKGYTPGASA